MSEETEGVVETMPFATTEERFDYVLDQASRLQKAKNKTYKDSWKKDGEFLSTFPNVSRKYDRIHAIIIDHVENGKPLPMGDASLAQGAMDLLVYCGLWLTLIAEKRIEEFDQLVGDINQEVKESGI